MASPVDTSVKFHLSTFSGAPVLSKTVGSLIGMLDAFLIDGYDTKTVTTLVVADGVATATFSAGHSSVVESVVRIAGCTGSWTDLNGDQKVIARPGSTSLQFATALANGTATGTITLKMAPAGWEKPYTGTNKAVYRSTNVLSSRMYLRVDDNATRWAIVTGYETMSDVDTGLAPFPTAAQAPSGSYWPRSAATSDTASATPRPYQFVADDRFFMVNFPFGMDVEVSWNTAPLRGFGDLIPLAPGGDPYAVTLNCLRKASGESDASFVANWPSWVGFDLSLSDGNLINTWSAPVCARPHTGIGGSVFHWTVHEAGGPSLTSGATLSGGSGFLGLFPSAVDGSLLLSRQIVTVNNASRVPRAYVPGLFFLPQSGVSGFLSVGDIVPAGGALNGRKLLITTGSQNSAQSVNTTRCAVDITGPWR